MVKSTMDGSDERALLPQLYPTTSDVKSWDRIEKGGIG
jgi:hypothetical protein